MSGEPVETGGRLRLLLLSAIIPALAVCLGWGIRGVVGHQRGAMIPGALAGLALALTPGSKLRKRAGWLMAAAVVGFSFGGEMTYGQTIGLTHGPSRATTYWWGMLGLSVKGGVWIGLGGLFIGMAAGRKRYTLREIAALCLALLVLGMIGTRVLNRPFQPPDRLPAIYFSNYWSPADPNNPPRNECWGGLWLGFLFLWAYVGLVKRDPFASRMAAWGLLGGAVGFPAGQSLQAWHAGRPPFAPGFERWMDWWKVMEMSFGFISGLALGLGEYASRRFEPEEPEAVPARLSPGSQVLLAVICLAPVILVDLDVIPGPALVSYTHVGQPQERVAFSIWLLPVLLAFSTSPLAWLTGLGLPFILHAGNTFYPYWVIEKQMFSPAWTIPVFAACSVIVIALAIWWSRRDRQAPGSMAANALAFTAWVHPLLTAAKEMIMPHLVGPGATGPFLPRFENSSTTVHLAFFALAAVLTAWAVSRRVDGRGEG